MLSQVLWPGIRNRPYLRVTRSVAMESGVFYSASNAVIRKTRHDRVPREQTRVDSAIHPSTATAIRWSHPGYLPFATQRDRQPNAPPATHDGLVTAAGLYRVPSNSAGGGCQSSQPRAKGTNKGCKNLLKGRPLRERKIVQTIGQLSWPWKCFW